MRHEDHSIETNRRQVRWSGSCKRVQTIAPSLVQEVKNVEGEELKNVFDLIHEQAYKAALQVFPLSRSVVWSFCLRITLERLTKTPACLLTDLE
jgi:hypothetical protein